MMEYVLHLFVFVGIYVMLSQSLALSVGFGGLVSLTQAGFYGIGAYSAALLSVRLSFPFLAILPLSMLINTVIAIFVSSIVLRTVDDYFVICTMGVQIIIMSLMNNWMSLTNGPLGISGVFDATLFGFNLDTRISYIVLTYVFVGLIYLIVSLLTRSAFGLTLRVLSEDEIFAQSLGKNVRLHKMTAFSVSAMLAAIPGVIYAHYMKYIDPISFTIDESIFILCIVIIGGANKMWKIALTATLLFVFPELLRFIGIPSELAANLRQILYGVLLIVVLFVQLSKRNNY